MSRSLNQVMLIGHLGQEPEVRSTQSGGRVATFSLATSRSWNGPRGDRQEKTEWHRCVVWNRGKDGGLADIVEQYVKKGDKVYVEGRIEYRQWQDKENVTRYTTEINVRELILLGGKQSSGDTERAGSPGHERRQSPVRPRAGATNGTAGEFDDFPGALDDESEEPLPF